jgi:hypothetical protein
MTTTRPDAYPAAATSSAHSGESASIQVIPANPAAASTKPLAIR